LYTVSFLLITGKRGSASSTVLRTTPLSYGNIRFSGICPT
jgi:hypothetical protein